MKKIIYLAIFAFLLLTACGEAKNVPDSNQDSAPATIPAEYSGITNPFGPEAASEGAKVYKDYCASCHGETGKGDGISGASLEPKPKDLVQLSAVVRDDYLYWRISKGSRGTAMVGWGEVLDEEQIWQVVSFVRTLK